MDKTNKTAVSGEITSVVAREADGGVQITFTIPFPIVQKAEEETVIEMANDIEVPGYRKGKAPISKVTPKIPHQTLVEHSLSHILPSALAEAIKKHNVKIAIYPKYELISAKTGEAWQVKAITCELPEIKLPDFKSKIAGEIRAISLKKDPTKEEKENAVIKYFIENTKFEIPKILIEEEVNSRLTALLSRIEKLGLALENYLASIGKNIESLRTEYETQAKDAIRLDLILSKIIETENIKIEEKELAQALEVSQTTNKVEEGEDLAQRKRVLESILKKRKALEFLTNLA